MNDVARSRAATRGRLLGQDAPVSSVTPNEQPADPTVAPRWQNAASWPWAACLVVAGVLSGASFVVADALRRETWNTFRVDQHWWGSLGLYVSTGAVLGSLAWLVHLLEQRLTTKLARRWPKRHIALRTLAYAALAGLFSIPTAISTFSGERISQTMWRVAGPVLFVITLGVAVAVLTRLLLSTFQRLEAGRKLVPSLVGIALVAAALALMYVDLRVFVALYYQLHTLLEVTAGLLLGISVLLPLHGAASRYRAAQSALYVMAVVSLGWLTTAMVSTRVRAFIDRALRHVWLEEVYVGRMLRRAQIAESFLKNPLAWQGLEMSRIDRFVERFDIASIELDPKWNEPLSEPPAFAHQIEALRGPHRDYNIVIYYVDTLRYDVAADPRTMPHTVRFSESALHFRRAYATGSDTLRSLPSMTGGNYDIDALHPNDLLDVARQAQHESILLIAKSAQEFLAKLRPTFRFDRTITVEDYPAEREVWGYGADQPTAGRIVDSALEVLKKRRRKRPVFMWLFNFDQHNWRELEQDYVMESARAHGVPESGDLNWRYRVVASTIDAEFGRLLAGLERLKIAKNTIVLFVSDHGEALGRDGFWVHSVFLWDVLVRVPLMIRIPNIEPRSIDDAVSLVDVAPTLARYLLPYADTAGYHGEDLLGYLLKTRPKRRLPLLMTAASKDMLVRVGMVEPERERKLILSLEAALLELYDIRVPDLDGDNIADHNSRLTLQLLSELVHSPVFPRSAQDFDMREPTPRGIETSSEEEEEED